MTIFNDGTVDYIGYNFIDCERNIRLFVVTIELKYFETALTKSCILLLTLKVTRMKLHEDFVNMTKVVRKSILQVCELGEYTMYIDIVFFKHIRNLGWDDLQVSATDIQCHVETETKQEFAAKFMDLSIEAATFIWILKIT